VRREVLGIVNCGIRWGVIARFVDSHINTINYKQPILIASNSTIQLISTSINPNLPTPNSATMPLARRHAPRTTATCVSPRTTRAARPSLKTRLLGGKRTHTKRTPGTTVTTTTTTRTTRTSGGHHGHATTAAPVHHHKRHASMGDKVSGALMKLRGSLTRRPGLKVSNRHS
jgi:hypothetical protein